MRIDQKHTNHTMLQYYKDLDENLVLTQKTEEVKGTRGNFTFATTHTRTHTQTHTVNVIEA